LQKLFLLLDEVIIHIIAADALYEQRHKQDEQNHDDQF
jgi:hypothetical protein